MSPREIFNSGIFKFNPQTLPQATLPKQTFKKSLTKRGWA